MAGVKGRSGRRTRTEEQRELELRRRTIEKAWQVTHDALDGQIALANKDRVTTAQSIAVKSMVDKQSVEMQATITQEDREILDRYISGNRIAVN